MGTLCRSSLDTQTCSDGMVGSSLSPTTAVAGATRAGELVVLAGSPPQPAPLGVGDALNADAAAVTRWVKTRLRFLFFGAPITPPKKWRA